jgi:PAT family beta-lactamase induction signal transducer AmpG
MLRSIANWRMLVCIFCGFSSGLPLYVLYQLIPAWLRSAQVDLMTIGLFSLISIPYTWKFIWSPMMDWWTPPFWGRRRGWAIMVQCGLLCALASLSFLDPQRDMSILLGVCAAIAFLSASQDIVLDAHRREILPDEELGIGNSYFVNAYRISSLVPGSLALILSDRYPWSTVHLVVASFVIVGMVTTWCMPEPKVDREPPKGSFSERIAEPFRSFFSRGVRSALLILLFMMLYKLGDSMATALATPFYMDSGFSNTMIGTTAKAGALWSSIVGGIIGGVIMIKIGINRALWAFGVVQVVSILGFALLASQSPVLNVLEQRPFLSLNDVPGVVSQQEKERWLALPSGRIALNNASLEDLTRLDEEQRPMWEGVLDKRNMDGVFVDAEDWQKRTGLAVPDGGDFRIWAHGASEKELQRMLQISENEASILFEKRSEAGPFATAEEWSSDSDIVGRLEDSFYFRLDVNHASGQQLGTISWLAPSAWLLFWVISFEYLGVGLGTAAFVAFTARTTDTRYTATQFALLTSLAGVPRTFASALTGYLIQAFGYVSFFLICTIIAFPGMMLLFWVAPWNGNILKKDAS